MIEDGESSVEGIEQIVASASAAPGPSSEGVCAVETLAAIPVKAGSTEVDLRPLKRAAAKLPRGDPVRQLIAAEPDSLPMAVLAAKADSWLLLLLPREG